MAGRGAPTRRELVFKPVCRPLPACQFDAVCDESSIGSDAVESLASVTRNWLRPNSITLSGSKLVADRFEAKFHYAVLVADMQVRTSFEPDSVMEFGL